jgi:twinkle protein
MDIRDLSEKLSNQAESVAAYLFPHGRRIGREWTVGSINGEQGDSCKVCVAGSKPGIWADFATGEKGDLIDLWRLSRGLSMAEALKEVKAYLGIHEVEFTPKKKTYSRPTKPPATKPKTAVMGYLTGRGLTDKSIKAYQVAEMQEKGGPWIVFPSKRHDELISIKYLHLQRENGKKKTWVEKDCEPCLFGWQAIPEDRRSVAICEGELDALSLFEYGVPALSVPFGGGTGEKHRWVETEWENLERFSEIYLCFDNDKEGEAATKDVAQRLGLHRCKIVTLPKKDANECLQAGLSKDDVLMCFVHAQTMDPEELKRAGDYRAAVRDRFYPVGGKRPGFDLPWSKTVGRLRFHLGEVSLWTGINGHGKSLLLGQVMMEAGVQGQKACIASFEMHPAKTLSRMVRQHAKSAQPSVEEIDGVMDWLNDKIWIFDLVGTAKAERLFEVFEYASKRYGIRQFVIDSMAKCGISEDDYEKQKNLVDRLGDFAKRHDVHIHLVAHARKRGDELSPPGKMDVKGTGALTDMVDNVFVVHRNKAKEKELGEIRSGDGKKQKRTLDEVEKDYDAFLICDKNREEGSDAEGSYGLYFDRVSQSYREDQ